MKRVSKWAAGLVCTLAILGSIVFSPLGHGSHVERLATLISAASRSFPVPTGRSI